MTIHHLLPFIAAAFSFVLACAAIIRNRRSFPTWCFCVGIITLGLDSVFFGLSVRATDVVEVAKYQHLSLLTKSFLPIGWLFFSFAFSRGQYREFLARWGVAILLAGLLPIGLAFGFPDELLQIRQSEQATPSWLLEFGSVGKLLNASLLIAFVVVLVNLEHTFRSTVGTMRWRIKFVVLGLGAIFGARIYTKSQAFLFSSQSLALSEIESGSLLIGGVFLIIAYLRTGFAEVDVYPSQQVLRTSITATLIGGYLFVVGVLAQAVKYLGGAETLPAQALLVLVGMCGLAVLLASDRFRLGVRSFVARNFRKSEHDSLAVWTRFSQRMADVKDQASLCGVAVRLISETFSALSVTVWLIDDAKGRLVLGASTSQKEGAIESQSPDAVNVQGLESGIRACSGPFDLENATDGWAAELRAISVSEFSNGGNRFCVPLSASEKVLGVIILADRVNGIPYSMEELDLLKCIGDQVTGGLLNLRLTNELVMSRELEAFRTMSAFFVHDLKNAAASLTLMLKNLPIHFNNPEFRADALRGIANTASRIDSLIARLSVLREKPELKPAECDLAQLASDALDRIESTPGVTLTRQLNPVSKVFVDREQIQSVVTNLVLNAREALGAEGTIHVQTEERDGRAILSVIDNGCGMSPAFIRDSLFRPFHSTKKKGLGIGMFQSRMIVEAHRGSIQVESETGKGTTFRISLPVGSKP